MSVKKGVYFIRPILIVVLVFLVGFLSVFGEDVSSCQTLDQPNTTYFITSTIMTNGTCFTITADNIILDGQNYSLSGTDAFFSYGIFASGRHNITIRNVNVSDFWYGISFEYTNESSILDARLLSNSRAISALFSDSLLVSGSFLNDSLSGGVWSYGGDSLLVENNSFTHGAGGVYVYGGDYFLVRNNTFFSNSGIDISTWLASNGTIESNQVALNYYDNGIRSDHSKNIRIRNNYVANHSFDIGIIAFNVSNVTLSGNTVLQNNEGIHLVLSPNSFIFNNTLNQSNEWGGRANQEGIYLDQSPDTIVENNTIDFSLKAGVFVRFSNRTVVRSLISRNNSHGVSVQDSVNVSIVNITSRGNGYGFYLSGAKAVVNHSLAENNLYYGIVLSSAEAVFDYITINDSYYSGVYWYHSNNTLITNSIIDTSSAHGLYFQGRIRNTTLSNVTILNTHPSFRDIFFDTEEVNNTLLYNTRVGSYNFSANGGIIRIENSTAGNLSLHNSVSGSGVLSEDIILGNDSLTLQGNDRFNGYATVTFYGLSWLGNESILRDSVVCSSCALRSADGKVQADVPGLGVYTFGSDQQPPVIVVRSPSNQNYSSLPVVINATLSETGALFFSLNGSASTSLTTNDNLSFTYLLDTLLNGSYSLLLFGRDGAENWAANVSVFFDVFTGNSTNSVNATVNETVNPSPPNETVVDPVSPPGSSSSSSSSSSGGGGGGGGGGSSSRKKNVTTALSDDDVEEEPLLLPERLTLQKNEPTLVVNNSVAVDNNPLGGDAIEGVDEPVKQGNLLTGSAIASFMDLGGQNLWLGIFFGGIALAGIGILLWRRLR